MDWDEADNGGIPARRRALNRIDAAEPERHIAELRAETARPHDANAAKQTLKSGGRGPVQERIGK